MTILIGSISQSRHDPTIVLTADDCSTETNEDGAESSNGPVQKLFCEEVGRSLLPNMVITSYSP